MDRKQILAFRLNQHHLVKRLPRRELEFAASSGILSGLGGMVSLALSARIDSFQGIDLEDATLRKKSLVELCGPRGAGWIVPTDDFDVFTIGAAPQTEDELAKFIGSGKKHLAKSGVSLLAIVEQVRAVAERALGNRSLTQDEIHEEWRRELPKSLLYKCKGCKSWHVHWMVVATAGLQQAFCYGPIRDGESAFTSPKPHMSGKMSHRG